MADSDERDTLPPPPPEGRPTGPLADAHARDAAAQRAHLHKVADRVHRFRVAVFFEEPTYALRREQPVHEQRTTITVLAADADDAVALATARFREDAMQSNVGWVRMITRCEAHPVGPSEE